MKPETLLKAMNDIDDEYIVEAAKKSFRLFTPFNLKMALSVATVCLVIIGSIIILPPMGRKSAGSDAVNAPVNSYYIDENLFEVEQKVEKSVDDDGFAVTTVINEENVPQYSVRKVDENILEVFNLPSCDFEESREINGTVYKAMGNDGKVSYVFWNRDGYNYLLSFVEPCDAENALNVAQTIN